MLLAERYIFSGLRCLSTRTALLLVAVMACFLVTSLPASAQEGLFKPGEDAEEIPEDSRLDRLGFVFEQIATATDSGLEQLIPILNTLLALLLTISLLLTFLFGAMQEDFSPFVTLLKKALVVGFILFFIQEWDELREILMSGAGQIGLIAGNSDLETGSVFNPSLIAARGFGLALAVLRRVADLSGLFAFFDNITHIITYLTAAFIILVAFLILSIVTFVALVEFYVGTTIAVILFPLGVLRATSFAAQSAFGYVIASAVKIAMLGLIIGLATSIFIDPIFDRNPDPLQGEALGIAFISLAIAVVAWSASSVAAGLVQGGPALGAGAALGPVMSAAGGGLAAARAIPAAGAVVGGGLARLTGGMAASSGSGGGSSGGMSGRLSGPPSQPRLPAPDSPPLLSGPGTPLALPNPRPGTDPIAPGGNGFGLSGQPYNAPLPTTPYSSASNQATASGSSYHSPLPALSAHSGGSSGGSTGPTATVLPPRATGGGSQGSRPGSGPSAGQTGVAKPAPPPAGEGRGGRGQGWRQAAAYGAGHAAMQDRGGSGYRGPDLERD